MTWPRKALKGGCTKYPLGGDRRRGSRFRIWHRDGAEVEAASGVDMVAVGGNFLGGGFDLNAAEVAAVVGDEVVAAVIAVGF